MELADVIKPSAPAPSVRRARVISVAGRNLTVDLGGGITIPSLDSCNPVPDQWVYIIGEGSSMMAVGAIGGVYRQATLTATSSTSTTVTGLVNGVSTAVTKAGAFTVTNGDVLPLFWAADNSAVWVLGKAGVPYVPPAEGGGSSGGGGTVTTGTYTYAASRSARFAGGEWISGSPSAKAGYGIFLYGSGRFRGLQGRTITGFRANLSWSAGGGSLTVYGHPHASAPAGPASLGYNAGSRSPTGWVSLPTGLANYLIAGSGTGGLTFAQGGTIFGSLHGIPSGTLQFDWRK